MKLPNRLAPPKVPDEHDMTLLTTLAKKYENDLMPTDEDAARVERAARLGRKLRGAD